ncbi:hypothetical protein TNCV_3691411 [Trichonephila clavipes]|nr:hypothetical protein TNCV_3691411 [Trichonephila clavipes]
MLQKDLAGMYPLCMVVGSSGQGMEPSQDQIPDGHMITQRENHCIWHMVVAHYTASVAEIQIAVGGVFQQNNARPHTPVVKQVLYRVLTCYLGLRDHHICLQSRTYEISLDNSSIIYSQHGSS